jgi:hypothetical protein
LTLCSALTDECTNADANHNTNTNTKTDDNDAGDNSA